jgi:CRISPR-associated protein Csm4
MQLECWNIQGTSFHFGQHGLGQEQTMVTMPSDSLFAALVARMARTYGAQAVDQFCRPFTEGKPPFVLSSTFPFAGDVRFFPVPRVSNQSADEVGVQAKNLKRVQFVSEGVFRSILKGTSLAKLYDPKFILQNGLVHANSDDFKRLPAGLKSENSEVWKVEQRPRVTLDRSSSASNLFHIGQVRFADQCGLWFAVRWLTTDQELKNRFTNMLHELAESGFGAERAVGMGVATVHSAGILELPDAKSTWITLSRYLPTRGEMAALSDHASSYSIKHVGGWLDSPSNMGQRRRSVNLIEEGSVIGSHSGQPVPGQMVDVQPRYETDSGVTEPLGHKVYRCGFALAVGLEGGAK